MSRASHSTTRLARYAAAAIAFAALAAMLPPLFNGLARGETLAGTVWSLLRFFTILTNLLVGLVFARLAWGGRDAVPPLIQGGVMLAIVLVGLVYNFVLAPMPQPNLWSALGDVMHHVWVPLAVPLWWLAFAPHRRLGWSAPFLWALYPIAYSAYVLLRAAGEAAGTPLRYPYPFMDAEALGWVGALTNMAAIAAAFVLVGLLAVLLDRKLPG